MTAAYASAAGVGAAAANDGVAHVCMQGCQYEEVQDIVLHRLHV